MCGGISGFALGIDLMYCTGSTREGRALLDVAVLVRRSSELAARRPDPSHLRARPPGATSGGGASVGPFAIQFFLPNREVWVDGVHFLTLPADHNVALLAEEGQALVVLGTENVRQDLGPSRRLDPASVAALPDRLREVFTEASGVRAFLESSVHPSFAPSPDHRLTRASRSHRP